MNHPSTGQPRILRALAWAFVLANSLAWRPTASAHGHQEPGPSELPRVKVNRTVPKVSPPPASPIFSAEPTNEEIFRARTFQEPLVPVGATSKGENQALAQALTDYLKGGAGEATEPLEAFLSAHPDTAWRPSLLLDLGLVYRRTGYFSRALSNWNEAWRLAKTASDAYGQAVADLALAESATLHARLGRMDTLADLLKETEGRRIQGSAAQKIYYARQGLSQMKTEPGQSFRCGPLALDQVLNLGRAGGRSDPRVADFPSTTKGTSLLQLRDLAKTVGVKTVMARRVGDGEVLLPAVVSWKAGHFAALAREEGGKYLVHDPTFGEDLWVSRKALTEEGTGYFLVLDRKLPQGWAAVGDREGASVWGKGSPPTTNFYYQGPNVTNKGGGDSCPGMPSYRFNAMLLNLNITDNPLGYSPRVGPAVSLQLAYNHKESFQPQIFSYSNFGPKWTFGWFSYIEDDPANPQADVNVYQRGGGLLNSTGYDPGTQSYAPELRTQAVIVRTAASPVRYERRMGDGSIEVFSQPDGALAPPRKVFLTSWADSQGNAVTLTYDVSFRIVALTDAMGQVTTVAYENASDPLKITRVTDPFGRSAVFEYNGVGELTAITDVIGLRSTFEYDQGAHMWLFNTGDVISSMTTPYGTTYFTMGGDPATDPMLNPWISATDPLGGTEKLQYFVTSASIPATEQAAVVPTGFSGSNLFLNNRLTVFWDKRAMALYPTDPTKAVVMKWLWDGPAHLLLAGVLHSEKRPLENRVWYFYPGQPDAATVGTINSPSKVARVLDDGTSQIERTEYGPQGNVTRKTDPMGRTTMYNYATNGIDLLEVRQVNGQSTDLLESRTYNSQHEPLTTTDASGQTTTYTYNAAGQPLTIVAPPHGGLTVPQRTTTYTYNANGVLQNVTGPVSGLTTTYTYDGYGRVRTSTDPDGYTLTYDYDIFDRPSKTTHPDGTYEETQYDRLDAARRRDRLGRWTQTFYDALRRVASTRDPAGRTTAQQWCNCGSLDKLIDGNGNATTWEHDLQGRVTKETRANGSFKTMVYETTTSRLKKKVDAKLQETQYVYALDDKLLSTTYVNAEHPTPNVTLSYIDPATGVSDAHGRLRQVVDGTGTTTYAYNPFGQLGAGQLASMDGPLSNDTVSYGYDELGRVVSRTLNGVTTTWLYDLEGRLQSQTDPIGTFGYTYEGVTGRVATVTYPNGQTSSYAYFTNIGDHRLQEIHHKKPGAITLSKFNYTYDAVGNIKTWTQQTDSNPAKAYGLEYDPADQLLVATLSGGATKRYRYAYDPAGNRTAEQIDDAVTGATYDNMNRLVSQQPGGAILFKGTTNEAAKVTIQGQTAQTPDSLSFSGSAAVGTPTTDVVVQATDYASPPNTRTNTYRVSQGGTAKTFTYDPNGNLTSDGSKTYEWGANNKLLAVKQGGSTLASFSYDGEGRRSTKTAGGVTTTFAYDGLQFLEERPSVGATKRYVYGPGIDQVLAQVVSGTVSYSVTDHLGSVVRTTDSTGAPSFTREYDPWGSLLQGSTTGGYAFTGREWDPEAQLYYYRARYYSPSMSRFLSEDPAGSTEVSQSLYGYVDNNPILRVDPSGLFSMVSDDPAAISQKKWNRIYKDTRDACCKLDKIITDPPLRANIKKSCDSGTIRVSNRCPPGVAGGPTDVTFGTVLSWFGGGVRTITVCANNWAGILKNWDNPGNVAIHEWAHGCGWWHFGGKGVPGQNGGDVHSPY